MSHHLIVYAAHNYLRIQAHIEHIISARGQAALSNCCPVFIGHVLELDIVDRIIILGRQDSQPPPISMVSYEMEQIPLRSCSTWTSNREALRATVDDQVYCTVVRFSRKIFNSIGIGKLISIMGVEAPIRINRKSAKRV